MRNLFKIIPAAVAAVALAVVGVSLAQIGGGGITGGGGSGETSGNFTVSYNSGFSSVPTQIINYDLIGHIVTLRFTQDVTGTSNAIGFANNGTSGVPAAYRPLADVPFWGLACTDNGATTSCCLVIHANNGGIDLSPVTVNTERCSASWTSSGTKGMQTGATRVNQITYSLL